MQLGVWQEQALQLHFLTDAASAVMRPAAHSDRDNGAAELAAPIAAQAAPSVHNRGRDLLGDDGKQHCC